MPTSDPIWLQPVDHTADESFIVRAPDLKQLFARAAWGMFSVITDLTKVRPREKEEVVVRAADRESLLVAWLSELNFRHITLCRLYARFDVVDIDEDCLRGEIHGEPIDPGRHVLHTEIKAVTYHGLRLQHGKDGWQAQVLFDV